MSHRSLRFRQRAQALMEALTLLPLQMERFMATQTDLTQAVTDLQTAVTNLENKTPSGGSPLVTQDVLDQVVAEVNDATVRVNAETARK